MLADSEEQSGQIAPKLLSRSLMLSPRRVGRIRTCFLLRSTDLTTRQQLLLLLRDLIALKPQARENQHDQGTCRHSILHVSDNLSCHLSIKQARSRSPCPKCKSGRDTYLSIDTCKSKSCFPSVHGHPLELLALPLKYACSRVL